MAVLPHEHSGRLAHVGRRVDRRQAQRVQAHADAAIEADFFRFEVDEDESILDVLLEHTSALAHSQLRHKATGLERAAEAEGAARPICVLFTPRCLEDAAGPRRQPANEPEPRAGGAQVEHRGVRDQRTVDEVKLLEAR